MVKLTFRQKTEVPLPGPEPPRVKEKSVLCQVVINGSKVYDSGYEEVGRYQSIGNAVDIAWAPDSRHVAYRLISSLRIVDQNGQCRSFSINDPNVLISSYRWIDNENLLVVSKPVDMPLDLYGDPKHYHGIIAKSSAVRIARLNIRSGLTQRFTQGTARQTFIYHSIDFLNQEISPYSPKVAFSDGTNLCVYDDATEQVVAVAAMPGPVEGIWWSDDHTLVLAIGVLSSNDYSFLMLNITNGLLSDQTSSLRPRWDKRNAYSGNESLEDWYLP